MYAQKANIGRGVGKALWLPLISILIFLSAVTFADAQSLSLKFNRFSDAYSHPKSPVNGNIIQDDDGFIWFGSWNGLFKYDGYTFSGYYHDPEDSTSLSNDWSFPYIDSNGTFWVGTGAGLDLFDPKTGRFTHFIHDENDSTSINKGAITTLFMDSKKRLWVGTEQGLSLMDTSSKTFQQFNHNPENQSTLTGNQVRAIYEDRDGNIWVGTGNPFSHSQPGGLNLFNETSASFQRFYIDSSDVFDSRNYIQSIFQHPDGNLWVAGWNGGLYHFDKSTATFQPIPYPDYPTDNIRGNFHGITHMHKQNDSNFLWIATYGGGLHRYDLSTDTYSALNHDAINNNTLSDNRLWVSFVDDSDVLWVGSHVGLNKANLPGMLPRFTLGLNDEEGITDIHEDESGSLWLGTTGMRALEWDPVTNQIQSYIPSDLPCTEWSIPGSAVLQSADDSFWFVNRCGLFELNRSTGSFTLVDNRINNSSNIQSDQPIRVVQASESELWLSSEPVSVIDLREGTYKQLGHDPGNPTSLNADDVDAIFKDQRGRIWIGTTNGVARYNRENASFDRMIVIEDAQKTAITDLTMGIDGNIYAASDTYGMIRLDPESGNFKTFTIQNGLQTNTNYGIIQDHSETFWVLSPVGLTRLNVDSGLPDFFDRSDGLVETSFSERAIRLSSNGEVIIGGIGAVNLFDPAVWFGTSSPPNVVLLNTEATDGYQTTNLTSVTDTDQEPIRDDGIRLNHRQNNLSFEYAGIYHRDPSKVRYQYMLENFDEGWIEAGTQRVARYSRLPNGTYIFKIRAAGPAGIWSETTASSPITILSPWWSTNWAYAAYILAFISLLFGFWRYELNRLQLRNRLEIE
ncbi:MAG: two-component regulator propeller domain-containing protein, partial [Balneolaceae bacterium]|nr:two-component regulator propeller domain-containing protein [Balneolaceae bacterium]